ncbi:MAG: SH3 domain-containing protein [Patescibacteria group bacterium]
MKKVKGLLIFLLVAALVYAVFLGGAIGKNAALSVSSEPSGQTVLLDNVEVGTTPYLSDQLEAGNPILSFGNFTQKVRLTAGALTVVDWTLGPSESFSGGQIAWFSDSSTGSELVVISRPTAEVFLNGESLGDSPLSKPLDPAEYDLEIKKDGYFPLKVKVAVKEGFRLNISANLALNPFPDEPKKLSSPHTSLTVWDLSSSSSVLSADPAGWVAGAVFWMSRIEEPAAYDFFLTNGGKIYDATGSEVSLTSLTQISDPKTIGYLGEDPGKMASAASTALSSLASRIYPAPAKVQILDTPIGYLRVRSGPGTSYSQIGQAPEGSKYTYLGEQGDWFKIQFGSKEGWVSKDYSKKL